MQKGIPASLALVCVLAAICAGCSTQAPAPAPTPTPQIIYVTVLVTPSATATVEATAPPERPGTLAVMAQSFTGKANLTLDGNASGSLTQSTPFTTDVSPGNHTLVACVGTACDLEMVQVPSGRVATIDLSAKLTDLAANSAPSMKIIDTTPAANQILVTVEFSNPTTNDLTMTGVVLCNYQFSGGKFGSGSSTGSGVAQADVGSGRRVLTIVTIKLPDEIGTIYVGGTPTISNFQYSKVAMK